MNLQHLGLSIANKSLGQTQWSNYIEPYLTDLKIGDKNNILDLHILKAAYESTLSPLLSIATRQGFARWSYR